MDQQIRVLVVDDDEPHATAVAESLERVGYDCVVATSGAEGLKLIEEQVFDIIITDLIMEGVGGLEVLAKAKREIPDAEVVILTGHSTIKTAVTAIQAGASTYLTKPLDINELRTVAEKASQSQRLQRSNIELQKQLNEKFGFEGVIGNSVAMHSVVAKLRQIAPTSASVLITGESGTGKELVAKALHVNGPRRNKPFVPLNCAELSREHPRERAIRPREGGVHRRRSRPDRPIPVRQRRHAFHGRDRRHADADPDQAAQGARDRRDRAGRHERSDQGQRPADLGDQLRSGRRHRRGEVPPGPVSPLEGCEHQAAALRERRDDIPLLIEHFLKEFSASHGKQVAAITPAVRKVLMAHSWPGNVRELKNTIESMVVIDVDGRLDLDDLTEDLQSATAGASGEGAGGVDSLVGSRSRKSRSTTSPRPSSSRTATARKLRRCWASESARSIASSRNTGLLEPRDSPRSTGPRQSRELDRLNRGRSQ